ncbi:GntR family transcriptional regulator [Companilactobacillus zhongbaensis]|uniref:GntR family transcriptional regulator n=1 Tax=Companilactobacillus zhongbaensis TaxID=2486009 RepID=UPI000F78D527|nr:GntR family transcriptional regulator [Companilactobacillus zhongbaensis]
MKFDDKIPIYLQIQNYLNRQIISGKILPGAQLPSVRQLAVEVTANVNTVQRALSQMIDEKIIVPQRGRGNFVTVDVELIEQLKMKLIDEQFALVYRQLHDLNFSDAEIIDKFVEYVKNRGALDE